VLLNNLIKLLYGAGLRSF